MFSGITNDDASLPGSRSAREGRAAETRDRGSEHGGRQRQSYREEGGEGEVNRRSSLLVITHIQLSVLPALISTLRRNHGGLFLVMQRRDKQAERQTPVTH